MFLSAYTTTILLVLSTFHHWTLATEEDFHVPGISKPLDEIYNPRGRKVSTWVGRRLPLPESFQEAPTVENCEYLASLIYMEIAKILIPTRSVVRNEANQARVFGLHGARDLVVAVFTYPGSKYFWASTVPHGKGWDEAITRVRGSDVLKDKLETDQGYVRDYIVHAEEGAFTRFEYDEITWPGLAQRKYPPGSVVGTWHLQGAEDMLEGTEFWTCRNNIVGQSQNNAEKGNRACELVTADLGVSARIRPNYIAIRPSGNCARGLVSHDDGTGSGPACRLPIRPKSSASLKGASTLVTSTKHSGLHATSASHGIKGGSPKSKVAGTNVGKTKPTKTGAVLPHPTKTHVAGAKPTMKKLTSTKKTGNTNARGIPTKTAPAVKTKTQKPNVKPTKAQKANKFHRRG